MYLRAGHEGICKRTLHTSPLEESCLLFFFFFSFFALSLSLDFDFFFLSLSLWTSRAASAPLPVSITAYWVEGAMQAGQQERHPGQSKGQYVNSIRIVRHLLHREMLMVAAACPLHPLISRIIVTHPLMRSCLKPLGPSVPLGAMFQLLSHLHRGMESI